MKSRILLLVFMLNLFGGVLFADTAADQAKVLLPPGIGYKNLRTALSFARSFYKKGEYKKGFELFKKCSEVPHLIDLHRAECLWYAALCAEKAGDFENAKLFYEKTLKYKGGKFTSNAVKSLKNLGKSKNILPDSSFENGTHGAWNRMITHDYLPDTKWQRDHSTAFQGKCSLRSVGQEPLVLMGEGFFAPGVFSIYMKSAAATGKVRLELFAFASFEPLLLASKEYTLSEKWQRLVLKVPKKYLRFEEGTAPVFIRITPLSKETLFADCVQLERENLSPYADYFPQSYTLEELAKLEVPKAAFVNEAPVKNDQNQVPLSGKWEFTVDYPVKAANVPVEMALPLPQGKWFGAGTFIVADASGKEYAAQSRVLARWPGDGSCRSVLFSFEADLKKGKNLFFVQSGKGGKRVSSAGKALDFTLTCEDGTGKRYLSQKTVSLVEYEGTLYNVYLTKGVLVREGRCLAPFEVRQKVWHSSGVNEISALVRNPGKKMLVLKNAALHFESGKAGKRALYEQYFNRAKGTFTHAPDGKCGFVQSPGGTLLMREASLRHPVKLEVAPQGTFTAHLWPEGLKSLILSRKTVLHREFVYTPRQGAAVPEQLGYRSTGMAKAEYFGDSRFFILPTGSWRKEQPFFKKSMGDYGFFFSGEAERVFNYQGRFLHGLFNYGDVYGDCGWGNLESYLDFSEMIYAVSMRESLPFKWALNRARHYRDSDIAGGVCCYHSGNHAGGFGYDFSHSWPQGVLYHYLLTGDLRSLDVIREVIANYMNRPIDDKYIQGSRSLGRYLLGLADFYALTGDKAIAKRFKEQLQFTEKHELQPGRKDQTLFRWHGRLDPFHVWYGCTAMMEMYLLTRDESILPSFRREIENSLNPDFYRNDLQELYSGAPFEETFPIHAGFLSCHRGALYYPLMKFYSELTGNQKYLEQARIAAYSAFMPGIPKAWPMDAMRLAVLDGTSENALLARMFALHKKAAAREVLNGDFSKSADWYSNWHLPAGRQMSYDDAVKVWPLREKKEFPKLINEYREREELVSPWRGYSRNFGWMDHKVFGEKAPSLRVTLSSGWAMGKSTTLACSAIFVEKGTYRFSGRYRADAGIAPATSIFFHMTPFGEKRARAIFPLMNEGKFKVETYTAQNYAKNLSGSVKPWRKAGWKEFEFTFTANVPLFLAPQLNFKLNKKSAEAHIHVDDFKFERVEK